MLVVLLLWLVAPAFYKERGAIQCSLCVDDWCDSVLKSGHEQKRLV